jgi:hypothetical protein
VDKQFPGLSAGEGLCPSPEHIRFLRYPTGHQDQEEKKNFSKFFDHAGGAVPGRHHSQHGLPNIFLSIKPCVYREKNAHFASTREVNAG